MTLVLDSSVAVAWFFRDEQTEAIRTVLRNVAQSGAAVSSLWRIEVTTALQTAVRRGRITPDYRDASIADLAVLDIGVDTETDRLVWNRTLQYADRFGLTLYDAVYLELAQRLTVPLASLDRELRAAGTALGLSLLGV